MRTMLTILNLYVLDNIIKEAKRKIPPMAQMVYINCLLHHFREIPATPSGAVAFDIFKTDLGDYTKFSKHFQDLHKAGLVVIENERISFTNVWGKHINRAELEKENPDEYVAGFHQQEAEKFENELVKSRLTIELCAMKYKMTMGQVEKLVPLFILEQKTFEKKYSNFGDCSKHFVSWVRMNVEKVPKETVKSNGKILGA